MTTDRRFESFVDEVVARHYDAAGRKLIDMAQDQAIEHSRAEQVNRLLNRCQRLTEDQHRLNEVLSGMTRDEDWLRSELLELVAGTGATFDAFDTAQRPPLGSGHSQPMVRQPTVSQPNVPPASIPPPPVPAGLVIRLLGTCWLSYEGARIEIGNGDRSTAVLRYLAAQPPGGIHKEQLAAHFWPESTERSARRSLHQVIYTIRRLLAEVAADAELQFVQDRYVLGGPDRWRDVDELEEATATARQARDGANQAALVEACRRIDDLYVGHFLEGHPYDDWAEGPRQHYRNLHREAAAVLLDHHQQESEYCHATALAERLLKLDPADEDACRHLMRAQGALGQPHLGINAFAVQTRVLSEEFGVRPSHESVALAEQLARREHAV